MTEKLACYLAERKGIAVPRTKPEARTAYRNQQYDLLADAVRGHLNMGAVYRAMEEYAR